MGGIAAIAKALGHQVTGSDQHVYPPMSTQLESLGIELIQGYDPSQLKPAPDIVIIGNAMSRGNPCVEYLLNNHLPYTSGPEWLKQNVLQHSWVLAVAGTHGKTTTSSMVAWILEYAGLDPSFLIGGVVQNFGTSARLGKTPFFVIEADEYDTAFFDKRSKFVHYLPKTLIANNLEFDHADIFADLHAIETQFHHLMRILPSSGKVIYPENDDALQRVIARGCWSEKESIGQDWTYKLLQADGSQFEVWLSGEHKGTVNWQAIGLHNVHNALAALAAARHVGIPVEQGIDALAQFISPKRRMEHKGVVGNVHVYDDFAHHPTAIKTTLAGLRAKVGNEPIIAILEPRSNTMKMGVHQATLVQSLNVADAVYLYEPPGLSWSLAESAKAHGAVCLGSVADIVQQAIDCAKKLGSSQDVHILVMSNGGFEGIHDKLLGALNAKQ
ncbi:UDP-N-acetylmuramate:L-alanyl-gamma-D-glutamyl-meso-diaminopimelate ligase [Pseudoalteromonas luteoviolacea B = ATCC 29581]|nr:UDP-N-acetylmuramate:L-alanyl-gamma-D-glutamyl-meso-diaminopimelate ligase [Pseudoalteromonas luteoviolacea B = ATCC 29581]